MSKRNSLVLVAEKVSVTCVPPALVSVTIQNPTNEDLIRIIAEASSLLNYRRTRGEAGDDSQ
jgi:hypothetical protein